MDLVLQGAALTTSEIAGIAELAGANGIHALAEGSAPAYVRVIIDGAAHDGALSGPGRLLALVGEPEGLGDGLHDHGGRPGPQGARPCALVTGWRAGRVAARHGGCAGRVQKGESGKIPDGDYARRLIVRFE